MELTLGVKHKVKVKLSRDCSTMSEGPCLHYLIDCNADASPEVLLEERIGELDCMAFAMWNCDKLLGVRHVQMCKASYMVACKQASARPG